MEFAVDTIIRTTIVIAIAVVTTVAVEPIRTARIGHCFEAAVTTAS